MHRGGSEDAFRDFGRDESATAKTTANIADLDGQPRTLTDSKRRLLIWSERRLTSADGRNAVFKTVCGALLRRPGWVRFPSIPAPLKCRHLGRGRWAPAF